MSGYSGTSLVKKLGIKEGDKIYLKHAPPDYFDLATRYPNSSQAARQT